MSKPKVFAIVDKHRSAGVMLIQRGHEKLVDGDQLIRLSDHEAAIAERDARIAELEQSAPIITDNSKPLAAALERIAELEKALTAMLEEGDPMSLNCGEPWRRARAALNGRDDQ